MTILAATLVGYVCGWLSVLIAVWLLRPKAERKERAEPVEQTPEAVEKDTADLLEQWQLLLNYDGRGGVVDDDKERAGRDI